MPKRHLIALPSSVVVRQSVMPRCTNGFRRVLPPCYEDKWWRSAVRRPLISSSPISPSIWQVLWLRPCELLPHTRLYNTYASTETGIIATYNFNDGECLQGCLGHPMPHSRLMITSEGLIACQGDTLMTGYVNDPDLTATILHDNTIFTADMGHIDAKGRLHLEGRQGDVINVGGYKVAPTEVENAALSLPQVEDCICIAVDHPLTGQALKLLVVTPEGQLFDKRQIPRALKAQLETYKVPLLYEQVEKIQRTYNGKINRKFYDFMNAKDWHCS